MAQGIAVQNGGLQDLIDPAVAGRGPVPESGLATFDLLALAGAVAGDGSTSLGDKKEISRDAAPLTGIDVSGDDFADTIDALVATGLLLKDGVTAKPFTPPAGREWVLSVTVPETFVQQLEPSVESLLIVPVPTGDIPALSPEFSGFPIGLSGISTEVTENGLHGANLTAITGDVIAAPGAVLNLLEELPIPTGALPIVPDMASSLSSTPVVDPASQQMVPPTGVLPGDDPVAMIGTPAGDVNVVVPEVQEIIAIADTKKSEGDGLDASSPDEIEHLRITKDNAKAESDSADDRAASGVGLEALAVAGLAMTTTLVTSEPVGKAESAAVGADDDVADESLGMTKWSTTGTGIKTFDKTGDSGIAHEADASGPGSKPVSDELVSGQDGIAGIAVDADDSGEAGVSRPGMVMPRSGLRPEGETSIAARGQDGAAAAASAPGSNASTDGQPDAGHLSGPAMQELAARMQERSADTRKPGNRPIGGGGSERLAADGSATGSSTDSPFRAAEATNQQNREQRQHERREERQMMANAVAQQKAQRSDAENQRATLAEAIDRSEIRGSSAEDRLMAHVFEKAEGASRPTLISAGINPAPIDVTTDAADMPHPSHSSFGSPTFFGVQQPTAGDPVFASRRPVVEDAITVEMRNRAIERQVLNALKNDKNEITMTLFPAHLGEVVIKLSMDGQKVRLGFKTANREAKDALIESEAMLKDSLANSGLVLSSLDISADTDARPPLRDAGDALKPVTPAEDPSAVFSINRLA